MVFILDKSIVVKEAFFEIRSHRDLNGAKAVYTIPALALIQ